MDVFGFSLRLPAGTADESIYRFILPRGRGALELSPGAPPGRREGAFQPSLVVTKKRLGSLEGVERVFEADNQAMRDSRISVTVYRSGEVTCQGLPARYQDRNFPGPDGELLYQRHVGVLRECGEAVLYVLTTLSPDLDSFGEAIGVGVSSGDRDRSTS